MERPDNNIMVIFGAAGDLTRRKLIPALFDLYRQQALPEEFAILGIGRRSLTDEGFRETMLNGVNAFCEKKPVDQQEVRRFISRLHYQQVDMTQPPDYRALKSRLQELEKSHGTAGNVLYYLAIPPGLYEAVGENLGKQGLSAETGRGWKRIIVEKPFGYSLETARRLNERLHQYFSESQIYRIDHYLGKETVQNVLAFRFANGIFEPLWNRNYIHHVEITGAEYIGVGSRGGYYEGAGALRDMVQNHLLQVAGMIAMEPPSAFRPEAVRNEVVKVLESLCPIKPEDVPKQVVRGQYLPSVIRGEKANGYREEEGVAPDSKTETFVAMKFHIDNWRWGGVPFFIRTGKRLPSRVSEVVIHFRKTPHRLFKDQAGSGADNRLVIRIQPDEGILLKFGMKQPGAGYTITGVNMDFHYEDLGTPRIPEAYERLLLDCMLGDATLYARTDAVEASWKFVDPILRAWKENPAIPIYGYPAGTWGPPQASALFEEPGEDWRNPCKNLAQDGEYCEL